MLPRFTRARPANASVALKMDDGTPLGYITWDPFEPGRQVAAKMVPILFVALFVLGAMLSLLLWRIRFHDDPTQRKRTGASTQDAGEMK